MSPSPPRLEPRKAAHPASCHISHYILPPPTKESARSFVSCTVTYDRTVSLSHSQNPQPTSFFNTPVRAQFSNSQSTSSSYSATNLLPKKAMSVHTPILYFCRDRSAQTVLFQLFHLPIGLHVTRRQPVRLALNLACSTRLLNYRRRTTSS